MKFQNFFHLMNSWFETNLYQVVLDDWKMKLLT